MRSLLLMTCLIFSGCAMYVDRCPILEIRTSCDHKNVKLDVTTYLKLQLHCQDCGKRWPE